MKPTVGWGETIRRLGRNQQLGGVKPTVGWDETNSGGLGEGGGG